MPSKRRPTGPTDRPAPKVTPAGKWRRQLRTELVTLPSGNTARLRKITLVEIATTGALPDELMALITEVMQATAERQNINAPEWAAKWKERTVAIDYAAMQKMINNVTPMVFLEPRIVGGRDPDYDAGEISLDDVDPNDRQAAFVWAFGEVGLLADFFPQPAGGVPAP